MEWNYALEYREQQQREWQVEQSVKSILERRAERKAGRYTQRKHPMNAAIEAAARACESCVYSRDDDCVRDGVFRQAYETRYTDEDFCGPNRRYFSKLGKTAATELEGK